MIIDDRQRELSTVLSYLVGRPLRAVELAKALEVSRSSYYAARDEGRLVTADNLIRVADAFGLNPVDLLVRYGLVSRESVSDYVGDNAESGPAARSARPRRLQPRMDLPPL